MLVERPSPQKWPLKAAIFVEMGGLGLTLGEYWKI